MERARFDRMMYRSPAQLLEEEPFERALDAPLERRAPDTPLQRTPPSEPGRLGRALSFATSGLDHVMLNAARSFFALRMPRFAAAEIASEIGRLGLYTDPETLADPERLLYAPPHPIEFTPARQRRIRGGTFSHLRARTPYEPIHPEYAAEYARYDRLSTVHLYAWRHETPAPASILLTHGWGAGNRLLHQIEFGVRNLFENLGLDVYFYVAPFHGRRRPSGSLVSGELHPSGDLLRTNEAFIQTVRELRGILSFILDHNRAPVGMMGSSLGGYTSALIASIDPRLSFAIPVLPPASLADVFWRQAGQRIKDKLDRMGLNAELFRSAWALHSPLSYQPLVPWERRLIISAAGDALVPASQTEMLWEHWERPRHFRFSGAHLLQVGLRDYHREIGRFLRGCGVL